MLAAVYLVINGVFAALYFAVPGCVENAAPGSFSDAFFFSIETLATVGYGRMVPVTGYGHAVSSCEIFLGLLFTAVLTGLIFVRFSRPQSRIVYADHPVVTRHEGRPALMVRVGNGRATVLTGATATMTALVRETTLEGQVYRRIVDLPLLRSSFPIFPFTLTLIHMLDETSPWGGLTPATLSSQEARLFVSVSAHDPMATAAMSDVKAYAGDEIVFGRRYADAVTTNEKGDALADMRLVSALEAE